MTYPEPVTENARGRNWTAGEDAYLREHGAGATADATGRSYASCQSRYNRLGLRVSEQRGDDRPGIKPPVVEQIVGVMANEKPNVDAIIERATKQYEGAARDAERKANQHIHFDHGPIAFFFVGDQHIGAPGTDIRQMLHEQELINSCPGAQVILTGDIMENAVVQKLLTLNMSHRTTQNEDFILAKHYVSQWRNLRAVLGGNHTFWSTRMIGLNIDEMLTPGGVIFDQDDISLTVHVGMHEVAIRARHKWQGSSIYSATHGQERAARFDTARHDVYVGAHIHRGAVAREFVVDRKRKVALLSSTYKHIDGFQAQVGFSRNDMSTAVGLVINNDGSFFGSGNINAIMQYMRGVYSRAA